MMDWSTCSVGDVATFRCIPYLLHTIINWLLVFAGVVALFFIVYAGIRFTTSGGEPKNVEASRKILSYAVIGLVLILSSFFIINLIAYATGVDCIRFLDLTACS